MKKIFLLFSAAALFVFYGCSAKVMKKDALRNVSRVGVLSVSVNKIKPDTKGNASVLKAAADKTRMSLEKYLKSMAGYRVVSAARMARYKTYRYAGRVSKLPGAVNYAKKEAEINPQFAGQFAVEGKASMADVFSTILRGELTDSQREQAVVNFMKVSQKKLNAYNKHFVTAAGMPFIPYHIFNENERGVVKVEVKAGDAKKERNYMKEMMLEGIGGLCKKFGLDAMVVAYVETEAPPLGSMRVISGKRALGYVGLDTTLVMIDKNGKIIADTGWKQDKPAKHSLPMYRVTKWRVSGKHRTIKEAVTDLTDAKGSIKRQLLELAEETTRGAVKEVADAMKSE